MNQEAHDGETTRTFLENLHLPEFIINQMYIDGVIINRFVLKRLNLKNGELFLSYVVWYSIGRFYVDELRTDSLMLTLDLRIA